MRNWRIEHTHRNVTTIHIPCLRRAGWEQFVLLRTDVHHDNPKCNQDLERKHLEQAKERNAPVIDNGDLFCAMQGKWDKRANKDAIRDEHAQGNYLDALVSTAADFYGPYASLFAVLGRGNHETAILKRHETDLTERLAERLRAAGSSVVAGGYGGWVRFLFVDGNYRASKLLHHYHGSGGGGPVTRGTIQTNRMAVTNPDADIVFTGHTHDEWYMPIQRQRVSELGVPYQDEQFHVRTAGYKDAWEDGYGGWEVEKMLQPKPMGAAWLRFHYEIVRRNGKQRPEIHVDVLRAK